MRTTKFYLILACVLSAHFVVAQQTKQTAIVYASDFAGWTLSPLNKVRPSDPTLYPCSASTAQAGSFNPFVVGSSIQIVDGTNSDTVTVTALSNTGNGCLVTTSTPGHSHTITIYGSATYGLQEAVNYAAPQKKKVSLTPDWTALGGVDATVSTVAGGTSVNIDDVRTGRSGAWTWNGLAYSQTNISGLGQFVNPNIPNDGTTGTADFTATKLSAGTAIKTGTTDTTTPTFPAVPTFGTLCASGTTGNACLVGLTIATLKADGSGWTQDHYIGNSTTPGAYVDLGSSSASWTNGTICVGKALTKIIGGATGNVAIGACPGPVWSNTSFGVLHLTGLTVNQALTNIATSVPAGNYLLCGYAVTTTSEASCTIAAALSYTNPGGATTPSLWSASGIGGTAGLDKGACVPVSIANNTTVKISATVGTCTVPGTLVYELDAWLRAQ